MDLILWRHAEAVDQADEDLGVDLARALTPKGHKQAARMAEWLNRVLPDSARVLVSPALRCQQTAQALQRKFQTREELGPRGGPAELLRVAGWPNKRAPVLVVGHQPTLGQVAAALMVGQDDAGAAPSWAVRKGAVWWLRRRDREGGHEVVLMTVRAADRL
ncbi:MAG: histidine phosphatase family protein [Burkholderiales bacterium]|nr:histidine phosphatase family protein [Burkholderiales bacterium]